MNNKGDRNTIIAVGVVLLLLIGLFVWLHDDPPKYDWSTDHYRDSGGQAEQPFGTKLFYNYLKSLRPAEQFHTEYRRLETNLEPFIEAEEDSVNYVLLGEFPYMYEANVDAALEFVELGNTLFLFSNDPPIELIYEFNNNECVYFDSTAVGYTDVFTPHVWDTAVTVNFLHPALKEDSGFVFTHQIRDQRDSYAWHFLEEMYFCEENRTFTPLGTVNDSVNFYRVPYGKGFFYFHSNPHLFTNYFLLTDAGRAYTEKTMTHLMAGDIVYDLKQWQTEGGVSSGGGGGDSDTYEEGPLRFILSKLELRWAFYVLLGAVVLSLLFAFQRKQRVIPVRYAKENSSLAYVNTITELYLQQGGQHKVFGHLTDQFNLFLRERYRIPTVNRNDAYYALIGKRARYAPVYLDHLKEIQDKGSFEPNISTDLLVEYYKSLNHFYEHCK